MTLVAAMLYRQTGVIASVSKGAMSWDDGTAKPKRFYRSARVIEIDGGHTIALDDRPLRTPAKAPFMTTAAAASLAAEEWNAQGDVIDPRAMPATRTINTAIDRVATAREAVVDDVAGFGASDLICYRADNPAELVQRQADAWNPLIDWSAEALGAALRVGSGVVFVEQPEKARDALRAHVATRTVLSLAALHELTSLSGSLVIALAVERGRLDPTDAWAASRIDEDWQAEQWGRDAEAAAAAARREADFHAAARLIAAA